MVFHRGVPYSVAQGVYKSVAGLPDGLTRDNKSFTVAPMSNLFSLIATGALPGPWPGHPFCPLLDIPVHVLGEPSFESLGLGNWWPTGRVQLFMEYMHCDLGMEWFQVKGFSFIGPQGYILSKILSFAVNYLFYTC